MSALVSLAIEPNVYYTVEEAAHLMRVSQQAMEALLESRRIHGVKIDEEWRLLGAALLDLTAQGQEPEVTFVSDWLCASTRSLREVWDNEEDAAYDDLMIVAT